MLSEIVVSFILNKLALLSTLNILLGAASVLHGGNFNSKKYKQYPFYSLSELRLTTLVGHGDAGVCSSMICGSWAQISNLG